MTARVTPLGGRCGDDGPVPPPPAGLPTTGPGPRPRDPGPVGAERSRLRADLGLLLASERVAAGLSQRALAEAAGVAEASVKRLENGRVRPSETMMRALAVALRPDATRLAVEVLAVRLERAAGPSLHRWPNRRPASLRRRRLRAAALELLDGPARPVAEDVAVGRVLAALDADAEAVRGG